MPYKAKGTLPMTSPQLRAEQVLEEKLDSRPVPLLNLDEKFNNSDTLGRQIEEMSSSEERSLRRKLHRWEDLD